MSLRIPVWATMLIGAAGCPRGSPGRVARPPHVAPPIVLYDTPRATEAGAGASGAIDSYDAYDPYGGYDSWSAYEPFGAAAASERAVQPPDPPPRAPSEEMRERAAAAVAALLAESGPLVRLRLFLPDPARSEAPEFDAELRAVVEAMEGACARLARVDVTVGPFDEAAVIAMRGTGILPRSGGDPDVVRVLLVARGTDVVPVPLMDPTPAGGSVTVQVVLALHRVLRGPIRVGIVAPTRDRSRVSALAAALSAFELWSVSDLEVPADLAALVVLASPGGPLPSGVMDLARRALDRGGGVVVIGGPLAVVEGDGRYEIERSPSDPSGILGLVGLSYERGLVLDPDSARVSVPASYGRMFLSYPPMPRIRVTFPGGAGEGIAVLGFASPIVIDGAAGDAEVLGWSSPASWVETGAVDLDPSRNWRPGGETAARPLVVAVEVPRAGGNTSPGRFVVIPTARVIEADHVALEGNAIVLAALVAWAARLDELFGLGAPDAIREED